MTADLHSTFTHRVHLDADTGTWMVNRLEPDLLGSIGYVFTDGTFAYVDLVDRSSLVQLVADPNSNIGGALLDAWLGQSLVDEIRAVARSTDPDRSVSLKVAVPPATSRIPSLLGVVVLLANFSMIDDDAARPLWDAELGLVLHELHGLDRRIDLQPGELVVPAVPLLDQLFRRREAVLSAEQRDTVRALVSVAEPAALDNAALELLSMLLDHVSLGDLRVQFERRRENERYLVGPGGGIVRARELHRLVLPFLSYTQLKAVELAPNCTVAFSVQRDEVTVVIHGVRNVPLQAGTSRPHRLWLRASAVGRDRDTGELRRWWVGQTRLIHAEKDSTLSGVVSVEMDLVDGALEILLEVVPDLPGDRAKIGDSVEDVLADLLRCEMVKVLLGAVRAALRDPNRGDVLPDPFDWLRSSVANAQRVSDLLGGAVSARRLEAMVAARNVDDILAMLRVLRLAALD